MKQSLVKQIIELNNKSAEELRKMHDELFENKCVHNASKDRVRPKIAYRLQELALGGLKQSVINRLEDMAKRGDEARPSSHSDLRPGTKIQKEYKGVIHEVEVLKDGLEYQGQKFRSLSAVAKKITGTKWNGPKFFQMRG